MLFQGAIGTGSQALQASVSSSIEQEFLFGGKGMICKRGPSYPLHAIGRLPIAYTVFEM